MYFQGDKTNGKFDTTAISDDLNACETDMLQLENDMAACRREYNTKFSAVPELSRMMNKGYYVVGNNGAFAVILSVGQLPQFAEDVKEVYSEEVIDGKVIAGKVQVFRATFEIDGSRHKGVFIVILRKVNTVVDFLEGDVFVLEQQAELCCFTVAGSDEFPADGCEVYSFLLVLGHASVGVHIVGLAYGFRIPKVVDDSIPRQVEGEVDKILRIMESFVLGCCVELQKFVIVEAFHSFG